MLADADGWRRLMLQAQILDQAPDAVIAIGLDERILYLNHAAERDYEVSREDALGKRLSELYAWRFKRPEDESLAQASLRERGSWRGDVLYVAQDGRETYVEATVTGLRDERGVRSGFLASIRDVSEQRATEADLRSALAAKDAFLGLVSHELRTPMTVILGMSRLLAKRELPHETVQDLAADISASGRELDELIESMLLLARLDDREPGRYGQPTVLLRVVEDVLRRQRERDPDRPYLLEAATPATLVEAEDTWLERILLNLLGNSSKYSAGGRPVRVIVEGDEGEVRVRVLDEGEVLDGEELERLFGPFQRGRAVGSTPGAGLGLAVCKRITDALGGRIWARARTSGGAEFGFALPILLPGATGE